MPDINEQYVYIHRDEAGDPVYIGHGRNPLRAVSHDGDDLSELLPRGNYSVEIAGPFGSVGMSEDVEAALISAFRHTPSLSDKLINKAPGVSRAVFRPLGVPNNLADRVLEDPLDKNAILQASDGKPVLCVLIRDHVTKDGRGGYHLADVPTDEAIKERMIKWWELGRKIEEWKLDPQKMPSILLALSGPIKHRMIVGSLAIQEDATRFKQLEGRKRFEVPIAAIDENKTLDFKGLRGRRIAQKVTRFSNLPSEAFDLIEIRPIATRSKIRPSR